MRTINELANEQDKHQHLVGFCEFRTGLQKPSGSAVGILTSITGFCNHWPTSHDIYYSND